MWRARRGGWNPLFSASRFLLLISFGLVTFLLFQDSINRLVEHGLIGLNVHALRVGLAAHLVKPAGAIRILVNKGDSLLQDGIRLGKISFEYAINVRNRLEALDPADDLSAGHRRPGFQ